MKNRKGVIFTMPADAEYSGLMIALYLPPVVAQQIAALPGVQTPAEELHVTLAYLPDAALLPDAQIAGAIVTAQRVATEGEPLMGTLNGLGRFNASPSSDSQDVLYAVVDVPGLDELRAYLVECLGEHGIELPENHGYNPHVTLAYVAPGADAPMATLPTVPIRFDSISVVVGGKRVDYPLLDMEEEGMKSMGDMLAFGDAVKALGNGRVGGYLVRFGAPDDTDLEGEFFDAKTDFGVESGARIGVFYNHGVDQTLKSRRIGRGAVTVQDAGLWIEAQLDLRDEYEQAIYALAEKGKLGWSSGTAGHLIERVPAGKATRIAQWPLAEASLTPTPAEYRNQAVSIKTWKESVKDLLPKAGSQETPAATGDADSRKATTVTVVIESTEDVMADEAKNTQVDSIEQRLDAVSKSVDRIMKLLESEPALNRAGYVTEDGGAKDKHVKSFGDFLLAVYRKDAKRLATVYGSAKDNGSDTKDLSIDTGAAGGYLVPHEYTARLLQVSAMQSQILSRVQTVPVGSESGTYPALDQYFTPTAGAGITADAGRISAATTPAGDALTETQARFTSLDWRVNKVGGFVEVENELIADSPFAIEQLLTGLFGVAISAKNERNVLRGLGAGEPLGILRADCAVGITPASNNLFAYVDALSMLSRFKSTGGSPVWIIHPSIWPDIGRFEVGTGGAVYQSNVQAGLGAPLLGAPILQSEHLPQADNSGCVILADLNAYLFFLRSQLSIAYSEHAAFTSDKGTWRFTQRNDGKPWLKSAITLADPQGSYTVSPFVYFND